MRYVKQKSTGRYLHAESGGDPSKPEHLQIMLTDTSRNLGIDLSDLEADYADDAVVLAKYKAQDLAERSYGQHRRQAYLSLKDQLDLIYWDKKNGTDNWEKHIDKVKSDYPKE